MVLWITPIFTYQTKVFTNKYGKNNTESASYLSPIYELGSTQLQHLSHNDLQLCTTDKTTQNHWDTVYKTKDPSQVSWVVSDVIEFQPDTTFDVWHDRATFHFLTTSDQIAKYMDTARNSISGFLTIGTFPDNGPEKCSGLQIKQYSEEKLTAELKDGFNKIRCITQDHTTPFDTTQNFLFCSFKRHLN